METRDLGLLVGRAVVGGTLFAHGMQKLGGWFGGGGIHGTAAMFDKAGFRPAKAHAAAAGASEAGAGVLLALGAATPLAGAAAVGTMAVAADLHRNAGFFAQNGGYEYPLVLGAAGAALALTGPGALSVDELLGVGERRVPGWARIAILAGGAASAAFIARRRRRPSVVVGRAESTVTTVDTEQGDEVLTAD
jgi:putative oxidoreductase